MMAAGEEPASEDDRADDVRDGLVQQFERTERLTVLLEPGELAHQLADLVLNALLHRLAVDGARHAAAT